jgi:glycosyltransferase involved in cell wall biosynthesis
MTAFDEETKLYAPIQRICTGMWRRDYLLKYPFSEKLLKGVDREYLEEVKKRGDLGISIHTNFGYYYRKHDLPSCAGKIIFKKDVSQIYVLPTYRSFIDPLVSKWKKDKTVYVSSEPFDPLLADEAEMIFCEFLSQNAVEVAKYDCKAFKILRLHSYEAFSPLIHYIDFSKFDLVIFVVEHIKEFVESKIGKLENAVVIPVGVKLLPFKEKEKNNKICYAGEISRKKGIGELFILAKELPEYEFHIAGKFKEEDIARWFYFKKPDNVFLEPYSYDLPKFFEDKTYFINTSLREGNPITVLEAMSAGLKPLISDWVGSEIYGEYVFKNLSSLKKLLNEFNPKEYREFAENYDFEKIYPQIEEILERENVISNTN